MRPEIAETLGYSNLRNELAWLVLRVIGKVGPCTETSLVAYISGDYTTSDTPTGRLVLNALAKLKTLGLIHSPDGQIAITDLGRHFLDKPPVDALSPRVSYVSFLRSLVPASATGHTARLQRFCQNSLRYARRIAQRSLPLIRSQTRAALRNGLGVGDLILQQKFLGRCQRAILGGALLVATLATAGGFAFLSGNEATLTISDAKDHSTTDTSESYARRLPNRTDAIRVAIQHRLSSLTSPIERKREQGALVEYYSDPKKPLLWVDENGLVSRAQSIMEEIARADEYGLSAVDYELPTESFSPDPSVERLADAEVKISFAVLRYAQDARGGRLKPTRLSNNLDPTLTLPDPSQVMQSIAGRDDPAVYLRSFQPSHPQFEALRQKLREVRREAPTLRPIMIIPEGPVLKKGVEHAQVALLRRRLEVSLSSGNEELYDELLDEAVRRFQTEHGVISDGVVGPSTRRILNQQAHAQDNVVSQRQILLNMERWRWLPRDLGLLYVNVNVPEFMARVVKDGEVIHEARVVVGKPNSQTPIFSHKMQEIVFGPYWNVPNSIKVDEIRPYLSEEWFFGSGWDTSIFRRQGLRVRYDGREVDPGAIDWNHVDIRNLEIFQPPGPNNVLGRVKFVFPNKHDVYMHDTTQKDLFAKPVRAESHGCVRAQNPEQLATVLLDYEGWSVEQVEAAIQNGYDQHVPLKYEVPVHITYFTLWVNEDGSTSTFGDLYGHDARMATALFGDSRGFDYPKIEVRQKPMPRNNPAPWGEAANTDIVGSIIRLLEN